VRARLGALARGLGLDGAVTALVVLACACVPLLAGPGVESALCLGVVVPPFIAGAAARRAFIRTDAFRVRLTDAAIRALLLVAFASFALLVISLLGDACEPFMGLRYLVLGPTFGFVLAAIVGVVAARIAPTRRRAIVLAAVLPVSFWVLGGYEVYATPGVFLYSPFAGLLPGVLYDSTVAMPQPYITYRALTTVLIAGIAILASAESPLRDAPRRALAGGLLLAVAVGGSAFGPRLGHRASTPYIRETLGARIYGERCVIFVPREMHVNERRLHARECDFHVESLERWLGVRRASRVHVYFYRSADEKRALMGAADTDVAKPWRGETHLVREAWPHPVLRHELAHVIAAEVSRGPFAISGTAYGLVPSPGLIEGLAVAASQESRDGLGPDTWSRAMLELDVLPSMRKLLGLGFLGEAPSTAYVASGSFLAFIHATEGPGAVRAAYRRGGFAAPELVRLERAWHASLRRIVLPEGALALARVRFERKGLFSAICPHVVARLRAELGSARQSGDERETRAVCARILALDENDASARVTHVGALVREGRLADAIRARDALRRDARLPTPFLAAVDTAFADAAVERGDFDAARTAYDALLRAPLTEDGLRIIEVKRLALDAEPAVRDRIFEVVSGRHGLAASGALAVHLGHAIAVMRADGLGPYLVGRQLVNDMRFAHAIPELREAMRRGLPTARLARENGRLLALALEAAGDCAEALYLYEQLRTDPWLRIEATLRRGSAAFCAARREAH
jgi:hypothetical protein